MAPLPRVALAAGHLALERQRQPWQVAAADYHAVPNAARATFARLLGAPAHDVALVPAISTGMAIAAALLPVRAGQQVLVLEAEYPSAVLAWRERCRAVGADFTVIPRPADGDWTAAVLARIDARTAVAALPHVHWLDGGVLDLATIRAALDAVGGALAVDAIQSLGVVPLDVAVVRPDVVACGCVKWLLGPTSTGFAYVAPRWQDGTPLEHGWLARAGSEAWGQPVRWAEGFQPGALRFDMGQSSNFTLWPVAQASVELLLGWGIDAVAARLGALTAELADAAAAAGLRRTVATPRAPHYLCLDLPPGAPPDLTARLAARGVQVSVRNRTVLRVTPHVHVTARDVARFAEALPAALR
ncbi:MAG: aminotransferase class V-fold PLP-dependent enzyme [Gemmatimonadales bacterium]|nr:aminotransferase class V-fold PLP-dependent enzyme [Gemmatimonadales bacterium]